MSRASAFDQAAALLRLEAIGLHRVVDLYVDPALGMLPEVWIGPAASKLEDELIHHRAVLYDVAAALRMRADHFDWRAEEIRRAEEMATPIGGVSGAL